MKNKETLEEAVERLYPTDYGVKSKDIINIIKQDTFINGAKWQAEQNEILLNEYHEYTVECIEVDLKRPLPFKSWFKQNKKK